MNDHCPCGLHGGPDAAFCFCWVAPTVVGRPEFRDLVRHKTAERRARGLTIRWPSPGPRPLDHRPSPSSRILLRCGHLTNWTGFGQIAIETSRALERLGVPVAFEPIMIDERYYPLDDWTRQRLATQATDTWCVQLATPHVMLPARRRTIVWTMWEVDRISPAAVEQLNRTEAVIVPCQANREWFAACGVTVPIHVVPLGIDPALFHPRPRVPDGVCRFGAGGRLAHGGTRKNLLAVVDAFRDAFPADRDCEVRLDLKVWEDCISHLERPIPADSRIRIVAEPMRLPDMADWLATLDVYVNPSCGEGWGMIGHQAGALGRPMIASPWSATVDFWDKSCGWELDYRMEDARDFYTGFGARWARPTHESLVETLRAAHADWRRGGTEIARRGDTFARRCGGLTWHKTACGIRSVLTSVGMLAKPRMALGVPQTSG